MSTRTSGPVCTPWYPDLNERVYFLGVLGLVSFYGARLLHELAHIVAHAASGGPVGTIQVKWFFIVPMFMTHYDTSNLWVVLAGPGAAILLGWYVGLTQNKNALDGPCSGRNKWKKRAGIVSGVVLQAIWDAIYLVPVVDPLPFDGRPGGDGIAIAQIFREMGLHQTTVVDQVVITNPAYLIAGVALLGTFYVVWRVARCTKLLCTCPRRRR